MIKAILTDFDNTLFDTRQVKPNWEGKPDWKAIFARIPECTLYEGWKETITNLSGIPLGIVSRNFKGLIYRVLGYYELHHTFNPVIDRYGIGKAHTALPKNELFALAMQHEGFNDLKRNEIIYLGDEATDIVQANQFGFLSGACLWSTLQPKSILTATPTFTLDSPSDLMDIMRFSAEGCLAYPFL